MIIAAKNAKTLLKMSSHSAKVATKSKSLKISNNLQITQRNSKFSQNWKKPQTLFFNDLENNPIWKVCDRRKPISWQLFSLIHILLYSSRWPSEPVCSFFQVTNQKTGVACSFLEICLVSCCKGFFGKKNFIKNIRWDMR